MFVRTAAVALVAALASVVSADLQVLAPGGPNLWWVAKSQNNIIWTCHSSQFANFTILVANSNPSVLVSPEAIIAVENNFDCSKTITIQQADLPASTGYTVQLANPLNSSDVYAQSQPFEVKALGAAYPDPSATPSESSTATGGSASATGTGSSGSGSGGKNGASNVVAQASGIVGAVAAGLLALAL